MLIDTHCHLDAAEFDPDRMQVAQAAWRAGVHAIVIPAVECANFSTAAALTPWAFILYSSARLPDSDLAALRLSVEHAMSDSRFVAIGEIGFDFFVPEISSGAARQRQEFFLHTTA